MRAYLNLGHTLGHAIEAEYGYGAITHGDAIAIGMQFALYVSEKEQGLSLDREKLKVWMKELGSQYKSHKRFQPKHLSIA